MVISRGLALAAHPFIDCMLLCETPEGYTIENIVDTTALRIALESRYYAGLAMLREAIEQCPDDLWKAREKIHEPLSTFEFGKASGAMGKKERQGRVFRCRQRCCRYGC